MKAGFYTMGPATSRRGENGLLLSCSPRQARGIIQGYCFPRRILKKETTMQRQSTIPYSALGPFRPAGAGVPDRSGGDFLHVLRFNCGQQQQQKK
jgi:hypothetical protein